MNIKYTYLKTLFSSYSRKIIIILQIANANEKRKAKSEKRHTRAETHDAEAFFPFQKKERGEWGRKQIRNLVVMRKYTSGKEDSIR